MNPRHDITSKAARRRATKRLQKLDNEFQEITRTGTQLDSEASLDRLFSILKQMRGIVRNADYTKTVRRKWIAKINLNEARLEQLKQLALEQQPQRIQELIHLLQELIASAKIGSTPPRTVWSHVSKTNLFLVNTQPSVHKTKGRQMLDEAVRGFRLWLRHHQELRGTDQS